MKSIIKKSLAVACMGLFMSNVFADDMMNKKMNDNMNMSGEKEMSAPMEHGKMKHKQHKKMHHKKMHHKKMHHKKMHNKKMHDKKMMQDEQMPPVPSKH